VQFIYLFKKNRKTDRITKLKLGWWQKIRHIQQITWYI